MSTFKPFKIKPVRTGLRQPSLQNCDDCVHYVFRKRGNICRVKKIKWRSCDCDKFKLSMEAKLEQKGW